MIINDYFKPRDVKNYSIFRLATKEIELHKKKVKIMKLKNYLDMNP